MHQDMNEAIQLSMTTSRTVLEDITSSFHPNERLEDDNDDVQTSNETAMDLTHSSTLPIIPEAEALSACRVVEDAELWNRKMKNIPNLLRRLI